jgi:hypothetical protein
MRARRRSAAAALVLLLAGTAAHAQPRTREECEAAHPVALGRVGKDVPWVATNEAVAKAMLSMAEVTSTDLVLDLGAGDGRIPMAAAKPPFGARAVGIEYDADLAKRAACYVRAEGLADRVRIVQGDIFEEDFGDASVVTMYLLPHLNLCIRHRLLAMDPGTRLVSHQYSMAEWAPEKSVRVLGRDLHLWTVPARVDGVWDFRDSQGTPFSIELRQTFGKVEGEVVRGDFKAPLTGAVHGRELRFEYAEGGATVRASGTVRGGEITVAMLSGAAARSAVGRARGPLRAGGWAQMPADCRKYYQR